jgi:predicted RNase H-like HicB family nuclease
MDKILDSQYVSGALEMTAYPAIIEQDPDTGLYVGYIPGFPGAHSQGATQDELRDNLQEVFAMLLDDSEPSQVDPGQP